MLLVAFAKHATGEVGSLKFTSVQLNRNYAARLHVDRNNLGLSAIVGVGGYESGGLWIMNPGGEKLQEGDLGMCVAEPLQGYDFKRGDVIYGQVHSIHNKWVQFDGRVPHAALPFTGTRISLVFFCRATCNNIKAEDRNSEGVLRSHHLGMVQKQGGI